MESKRLRHAPVTGRTLSGRHFSGKKSGTAEDVSPLSLNWDKGVFRFPKALPFHTDDPSAALGRSGRSVSAPCTNLFPRHRRHRKESV